MPQAIPFIVAAVEASAASAALVAGDIAVAVGVTGAAASAVMTAAYVGVIGATIGGVGLGAASLFTAPPTPKPQAIGFPVRQSTPARRSGYGRCKLSGAYMLFAIAPDGTSTDVLALHDGLIDGYEFFYLNDDRVTTSGGWVVCPGNPDGRYDCKTDTMVSDKLQILTTIGAATNTAITSVASSAMPAGWDSSHRGDGIATLALGCRTPKLTYYDTIYPNGLPMPAAVARLSPVFDFRDEAQLQADPTTWAWKCNPFLQLADYLTHPERGMGLSYARRIAPALAAWQAAADDCDSPEAVIHQSGLILRKAAAGSHTIELSNTRGLAAGIEINVGTAIATLETATVDSVSGDTVTLTAGLTSDHSAFQFCSWASDGDSPPTEPRYESHGVFEHISAPSDVVGSILSTCDGWIGQRGDGALIPYSGRFVTPTVSLGPDAIVAYTLQRFVEDESATNSLVVKFTSPDHDYSSVETDPWRDEDDIAARGVERPKDLTLDWVQSYSQARRLAKRRLARELATARGSITTNLLGMDALGERYIHLRLEEEEGLVLFDGPVEIQSGAQLDLNTLQLTFPWIAADPNVDQWAPEIEEGNPPTSGDWTALEPLVRPVISAVAVDYASVASGSGGVRLQVAIADLDRDDLTFALRWRQPGGFWSEQEFRDVDDTAGVVLTTGFVPADADVDVEAAYATGDGRASGWSSTFSTTTATDSTPPDTLTGLAVGSWDAALALVCNPVPRARQYLWSFYAADGTTLVASYPTTTPSFIYTAAQAAQDGVRRDYVIKVHGINGAGAGAEDSLTVSHPAPAALTGVSATGGATTGEVDFDAVAGVAGYLIPYANTSGFDPSSYGSSIRTGASPGYLYGLPAGTYYARAAAYDAWSADPSLLNLSSEVSFVLTAGGGSTPAGGGGGGGGGGFHSGHIYSY